RKCLVDQLQKRERWTSRSSSLSVTRKRSALRGESLPTLVASRSTNNRRAFADRHVTKLARGSSHSLIHLAIEDDSSSESFLDQHENEVAHITNLRSTKPQF